MKFVLNPNARNFTDLCYLWVIRWLSAMINPMLNRMPPKFDGVLTMTRVSARRQLRCEHDASDQNLSEAKVANLKLLAREKKF